VGHALDMVGGDKLLLGRLVRLFQGECPHWRAELCAALQAGACDRLRTAAHTLKGSLLIFGAKPAATAALQLERLGHGGILAGTAEAWTTLEGELARLLPALGALAGPNEGEVNDGDDPGGR
jgi:HPt (histidine-containing phosphotransfer) domain-containing protein